MVKYTIMKRLTQIFASILFIITILTIYLTFDFAINNVIPKKHSTDKHEHMHDDNKLRKLSSALSLLKINKSNRTSKHNNDNEDHHIIDQERRTRSFKQKQHHAQFHKSKTGIKVNQIKNVAKEQQKPLLTTKTTQYKDIKIKTERTHI